MPPYAVQPGTTLANRYRLEEHLGTAGATTSWRAVDALLQRPVAVHTLPADADGAEPLLAAARAAAQLVDARFLRVLDASTIDGTVYVVTEWVEARDLTALLADGPLPAAEAVRLATEVADGLAAAHTLGLSHLRLRPGNVLRADNGQVKIAGLAVDVGPDGAEKLLPPVAAASVEVAAERARLDARGCGAVLYAALTARWPDGPADGLAAAPSVDNHLCAPRQVRAGIPDDLDAIACQALGLVRHGADVLRTPAEVASALRAAAVTTSWPSAVLAPVPATAEPITPGALPPPPGGQSTMSRLTRGIVAAVVAAGAALGVWQLALAAQNRGDAETPARAATSASAGNSPNVSGTVLTVAAIRDFDPQGTDGGENGDRVKRAVDGDTTTAWTTSTYEQQFGPRGLKTGVGLVLDLGSPHTVSTVSLDLEGRGTSIELAAADAVADDRDGYRTIAKAPGSGPMVTLRPSSPVTTRYLLVWLTELPRVGTNAYRAGITGITVRG